MEVKFGKIRSSNTNSNIFSAAPINRPEDNFFAPNPDSGKKQNQNNHAQGSRLNDLDTNLLENNAYQEISDEMFKIEHKIGMLESLLSKLNNEIDALQSLGNNIQISDLIDRKQKVEQELVALNKKYSDLGLGAKLSGQITSAVGFTSKKKTSALSKFKNFISKKIFSKISKKFNYNQIMREALGNLENINTSVDELITLKVPYGETVNRYEKLTAYLNKANVIHSQITRDMNAITKNKKNN